MNFTSLRRLLYEKPESFWQRPLRLLRAIRRNPIKQFGIERHQIKLLRENYPAKAKKLIIFVTTNEDMVNGGIMSICAHYEETTKIQQIHGAEVILCSGPDKKLLLKYTKFKNNNYIFGFSGALSYFQALESIMIHIPEYMADRFVTDLSKKDLSRLKKIKNIHINIMLQNINGLKFMKSIKGLERFGKVTCTTAHRRYSTLDLRKELGVPLHLLSVRGDPKGYNRKKYNEKDDLLIISPDEHPMKSQILKLINEQLPQMKMRIIANLTHEEYKRVIERAKWALTFGEGLDGYFVETIFSGGISFSVYNSDYFTEEFRSLRTVYDSYDSLIKKICSDIKSLDEQSVYTGYQDEQYAICSRLYNNAEYYRNLSLFYDESYTFK
ncbi:MAG TPA: hypothetical protein VLX29_08500 [Nitrospirota bacterium]|nr:hypothetical protein [Nitrospirota bacterium]